MLHMIVNDSFLRGQNNSNICRRSVNHFSKQAKIVPWIHRRTHACMYTHTVCAKSSLIQFFSRLLILNTEENDPKYTECLFHTRRLLRYDVILAHAHSFYMSQACLLWSSQRMTMTWSQLRLRWESLKFLLKMKKRVGIVSVRPMALYCGSQQSGQDCL